MSGIVFFGTESLERVVQFFVEEVGASIRLEQPDCTILQYDNLRFGFCDPDDADTDGVLTFVLDDRAAVDESYESLAAHAVEPPGENERYEIYHWFGEDPEGRTIEFQAFDREPDEA